MTPTSYRLASDRPPFPATAHMLNRLADHLGLRPASVRRAAERTTAAGSDILLDNLAEIVRHEHPGSGMDTDHIREILDTREKAELDRSSTSRKLLTSKLQDSLANMVATELVSDQTLSKAEMLHAVPQPTDHREIHEDIIRLAFATLARTNRASAERLTLRIATSISKASLPLIEADPVLARLRDDIESIIMPRLTNGSRESTHNAITRLCHRHIPDQAITRFEAYSSARSARAINAAAIATVVMNAPAPAEHDTMVDIICARFAERPDAVLTSIATEISAGTVQENPLAAENEA